MQFDRRDRCLHICMLGDGGIGHSSFLKSYGTQAQAGENAGKDSQIQVYVKLCFVKKCF